MIISIRSRDGFNLFNSNNFSHGNFFISMLGISENPRLLIFLFNKYWLGELSCYVGELDRRGYVIIMVISDTNLEICSTIFCLVGIFFTFARHEGHRWYKT